MSASPFPTVPPLARIVGFPTDADRALRMAICMQELRSATDDLERIRKSGVYEEILILAAQGRVEWALRRVVEVRADA